MTDRHGSPEPGDDSGFGYDREPAGVPRWAKVVVVIVIVVALLVVVMMLAGGGGGHGPGRHG